LLAFPVQLSPQRAFWGTGHMPPQGIWRSVQAQVPFTQSQRRATQSPDHEQVAPAGAQAVPAMVKGQAPASTDTEALASATAPDPPPTGPFPGNPPAEPGPAPPVPGEPVTPPPGPPTTGGADPPDPAGETSPLP
jgi:hypothetical protein